MRIKEKTKGSTDIFYENIKKNNTTMQLDYDENAENYNYLTKDKKEAAKYAKIHENPSIIRVIITKQKNLQIDPEAKTTTACRTSQDIGKEYVLPDTSPSSIEQIQFIVEDLGFQNLNLKFSSLNKEEQENFLNIINQEILKSPKNDKYLINEVTSFIEDAKKYLQPINKYHNKIAEDNESKLSTEKKEYDFYEDFDCNLESESP